MDPPARPGAFRVGTRDLDRPGIPVRAKNVERSFHLVRPRFIEDHPVVFLAEVRPAHEGEAPVPARGDSTREQRRLDGDGARPAERVQQRILRLPPRQHQQPGSQIFGVPGHTLQFSQGGVLRFVLPNRVEPAL